MELARQRREALTAILTATLNEASPAEVPLIPGALELIDSDRPSGHQGPFAFGGEAALALCLPFLIGLLKTLVTSSVEGLGKAVGTRLAEWLLERKATSPPDQPAITELIRMVERKATEAGLAPPDAQRIATAFGAAVSARPELLRQVAGSDPRL
jgi:hypothetical protein